MVQAPGRVLIAAMSSLVGQAAKCDEGKAAADSSFHLDFSHAVNLKMFGEIQHKPIAWWIRLGPSRPPSSKKELHGLTWWTPILRGRPRSMHYEPRGVGSSFVVRE